MDRSGERTITNVMGSKKKKVNKKAQSVQSLKAIKRDVPAGSVGESWDLGGLPDGDPYPSGVGLSLAAMVSPALTVS